jgi:hypothetical protein
MTIEESQQPITAIEIQEFEKEFNLTLPENFKKFYRKFNGGFVYDDDDDLIAQIFTIKYGDLTLSEMIQGNQILEKNVPREYLPFATTDVGHIITALIDSQDPNFGKIYLFRHDTLEPEFFENSLEELLEVDSIDDL